MTMTAISDAFTLVAFAVFYTMTVRSVINKDAGTAAILGGLTGAIFVALFL